MPPLPRPAPRRRHASLLFGGAALADGDEATDESYDECQGDRDELHSQPLVGAGLPAHALGFCLDFGVSRGDAGVEELQGHRRDRVPFGLDDISRGLQARAAIERAGVAIDLVPRRRRFPKVAEDDKFVTVLVDPTADPGPLAEQRFVRDLDGRESCFRIAIACQQPGVRPGIEQWSEAPTSSLRFARRRVGSPSALITTSCSNNARIDSRSGSSSDE